jgi:integrase
MYTDGQERAKVGRVSVDIKGKSYRLRFTYPEGERHEFSIARVSPEGWSTAIRAAQLINRDIDLGDFDSSYVRYSPKHAKSFQIAKEEVKKEYNLKELWEAYKEQNKDRIALTTQKKKWKVFDRILEDSDPGLLSLDEAVNFMKKLTDKYTVGTLNPLLAGTLHPAVNLAIKEAKAKDNPYSSFKLKKQNKSPIECFETSEIKSILNGFKNNEFQPLCSHYEHSYYAPMVEFLALTGCRPSEAHALTWGDIKYRKDRVFVRFNKAYNAGILLPHTKTHEVRLFPCNDQLRGLIKSLQKIENDNDLIFPSVEKRYVDQSNFRERYWNVVVKGLVKQGRIDKYLKPYCLRHSFITRLVREGVDIATIASLSGNSAKIILERYLASRKDFDLPEL